MRQERYVNNTKSTLDGLISSGATSLTLDDGSEFPAEGDFRILIESELLLVTARSTHVLTVERGIENTTPAEHADAQIVRVIVTEGSLQKHLSDFCALYIPDNTPPFRIFKANGDLAAAADFTWYNQGGEASTVDVADGSILLKADGGSGSQLRGKYITPPSTPYVLTAAFSVLWRQTGTTYPRCGITIENSGDGKLVTLVVHHRYDAQPGIQVAHMDSYSSYDAPHPVDWTAIGLLSDVVWLRFADDSVNHKFYLSVDGTNWLELLSQARDAYLSNGGNRIGFGHDRSSNVYEHHTYLKHWSLG